MGRESAQQFSYLAICPFLDPELANIWRKGFLSYFYDEGYNTASFDRNKYQHCLDRNVIQAIHYGIEDRAQLSGYNFAHYSEKWEKHRKQNDWQKNGF